METSDPKYKHKPSEKHTLEEVLKSLQDLIRNDLAEGAAAGAKPGSAPAEPRRHEGTAQGSSPIKSPRENATGQREDFTPVAPGAGPVNLDAVLHSLKDLIGNELNVGDEPAATGTKPVSTHDEYLATQDGIEEYIPEELTPRGEPAAGNGLDVADEPKPPAAEPPSTHDAFPGNEEEADERIPEQLVRLDEELIIGDEPFAPQEISVENLPQEFAPLDEELTFEEPAETAPSAPPASATPELPGEISPELLGEAETASPQAPELARVPDETLTPGTQQEMFLEEPPPIELRVPPPPEPETAPAPAPEPVPEPETSIMPAATAPEPAPEAPATEAADAPPSEDSGGETTQALPTIEVEESFDTGNYFDGTGLSAENSPAALEEIVVPDLEISGTPETTLPVAETSPATPTDAAPAPEPPAAPVEKKITLELASEPAGESHHKTSVDFDAINLAPSQPDQIPPAAETRSPESQASPLTVAPDTAPAPEPEKIPAETPPVTETRAETPTRAEPSAPTPPESVTVEAPEKFNLEDIPVLNEVVAPPAGSVPAATPAAAPPRPAPDRARDIVVRAVAKLNVEMRKAGGAGLNTKTILRLQQLIRQELEKGEGK